MSDKLEAALRTISEAVTSSKVNLTPAKDQTLSPGIAQAYAEPNSTVLGDVVLDLNGAHTRRLSINDAERLGMWLIRSAGEAKRWREERGWF